MRRTLIVFFCFLLLLLGTFFFRKGNYPKNFGEASPDSTYPCVVQDAVLSHRMKPGCNENALRLGKSVRIRINSLGLRGPEYRLKRKDELRILLLGPSGVFGVGQEEAATISSEVERILTKKFQRKITVINGGIEGYFVVQHYLSLPLLLKKLHPDITMLVLAVADGPMKDMITMTACKFGADGFPLACARNPAQDMPTAIAKWIWASPPNFFRAYTAELFYDRLLLSWKLWLKFYPNKRIDFLASPLIPMLKKMAELSSQHNSEFFIFEHQVGTNNRPYIGGFMNSGIAHFFKFFTPIIVLPRQALYKYLLQSGLPVLTFQSSVIAEPWKKFKSIVYVDDGFHISPSGVHLFASGIAEGLSSKIESLLKRKHYGIK